MDKTQLSNKIKQDLIDKKRKHDKPTRDDIAALLKSKAKKSDQKQLVEDFCKTHGMSAEDTAKVLEDLTSYSDYGKTVQPTP